MEITCPFYASISPIIAGTLADYVFEPAMQRGGALPAMFSWLVGTSPGTGMGFLLVVCGILSALVGLAGYFFRLFATQRIFCPITIN
jgi:DHA3 family macrolide efflux protein-like MFS transporter